MKCRVMFQIMKNSVPEYTMFEYCPLQDITAYELARIVPILKTMNPDHEWYSKQGKEIKRHFKRVTNE